MLCGSLLSRKAIDKRFACSCCTQLLKERHDVKQLSATVAMANEQHARMHMQAHPHASARQCNVLVYRLLVGHSMLDA